jgi:hypothetical protein
MTFPALRKTGLILLLIITAGCSGDSMSDSSITITSFSKEKVVNGLVYGYTAKTLSGITGAQASPPRAYTSIESGQYAITNYPDNYVSESIFYASFNDDSRLYSVWSGVPTPLADVEVTFNEPSTESINPASVTVSPDNFAARANINPITDLAYWYWLYEKKKSPYYYYLTSVFLFFKGRYFIPEQNAVHDYPSPELLNMLGAVQIKIADNAAGFSLVSNSTGKTICTATFAQFPICY